MLALTMADATLPPSSEVEALSGDRPIAVARDDRLGFQPLAERLALALVDQASTEGMVVGLEGRWGSGKSSLLKLTQGALQCLPEERRPLVVEFKPWLIGDRDALLGAFFTELATAIETLQLEVGHSSLAEKRKREELAARLRKYAAQAEVLGSILSAVPAVGGLGKIVKAIGAAGKSNDRPTPLLQLKLQLDEALSALDRRIVISIDDVDRLEPREVTELLRLVRSVADFKNVIYVLCYDGDILAHGIQNAMGVADGHAFLEKIVQVSVAVPIPEPFHLRRWFEQDLNILIVATSEADRQRVRNVIDSEGARRLETPRHVVRVLNTLRMLVPALRDAVDLADLVWLQMVRATHPRLYRWIESYCAEAAAASHGKVTIPDEAIARTFAELEALLALEGRTFEASKYELDGHLPGIETFTLDAKSDRVPIFKSVDDDVARERARQNRLSSPDHYRLYFALSQPSTAPKAVDFEGLLKSADEGPEGVVRLLEEWAKASDPALGSKAEMMLDRVRERGPELLTSQQAENILLALADRLDAISPEALDDFGRPSIWREADRALPVLLAALDDAVRPAVVARMFADGHALAWLTSLLRRETFAHGRFGERPEGRDRWYLSDDELDEATSKLVARYRSLSVPEIFSLRDPISLLFAWAQAGYPDEPREKLAATALSDEGLITVLEWLTTVVHSTGGDYRILKAQNFESFLDGESTRSRLAALARDPKSSLRSRAEELLRLAEKARSY